MSAAAPVAVAAAAGAGGGIAEPPIGGAGVVRRRAHGRGREKKINVIKVVRSVTGLPGSRAKDLVDGAPNPIKEGAPKEEAEQIKAQLEEAGAGVELK